MTPTSPNVAVPEAFQGLDERYERLPLTQIVASKTNPRTHFPEDYIAQLAQSLLDKGCVEPIVVRPLDVLKAVGRHPEAAAKNGAKFEIVAGECRFRAATLAKLTHLPSVIRAYSDEQVLELQLIENLHRKDLTPLEQARGYRRLIDTNPDKHSAESIATRIGMSPAWVWDRMKLNDLIPEAKRLLEQERMSVGHAILIARQKPEDQARIIDPKPLQNERYGQGIGLWTTDHARFDLDDAERKQDKYAELKPVSVRELEAWIRDHIRFDVTHAAKAQPLAFEETAAKVQEAAAEPGRGKKVIAITHEYRVADDARDESERTFGSQSWKRADGKEKSKTCDYSVLGLVVAGEGQGESFRVCVARDKCLVHFGAVIREKERNAKLRASGKVKQAAAREAKQRETWQEQERKRQEAQRAWDRLQPRAIEACIAKTKAGKLTDAVLRDVFSALCQYNTPFAQVEKHLGKKIGAATFVQALSIRHILAHKNTREYFQPVAKKYGVDLAKLERATAEVTHTAGVKKAS